MIKRDEVWWINFDPSVGGETRKKRPAIIVSNNAANQSLHRVQVVPLTSSVGKLYQSEAPIRELSAISSQQSAQRYIRADYNS